MNVRFTALANVVCALFFSTAVAQTQVVTGVVKDLESKFPLVGASVALLKDSALVTGAFTDAEGRYRIDNVPVGRYNMRVNYVGYKPAGIDNVVVGSGKQTVQDVMLEASAVKIESVVISAYKPGETRNEMATVSAKPFTVEETNRYAGSRADPARMASNFAGVQGADDSRNDIVVRGNSPGGVLWRMENVDIFNPNHFSIPGTAGGPVSILNNKFLSNSDFFTGAFPAEFGNTVSGIFDLYQRSGNRERYEFSGQLGFLGMEALAEGPIKKSKSSFLATYRYSTLALFEFMGIDIGTSAAPKYQDGFVRLNFPLKNNANVAVFGMGGISGIDILISDQEKPERNIYGQNDRDQYFDTKMGVVGVTFSKSFSDKTFTKATVSAQSAEMTSHHELVFRHVNADSLYVVDSLVDYHNYAFRESRFTVGWFVNQKLASTLTLKAGVNAEALPYRFVDSVHNLLDTSSAFYYDYSTRWNSEGVAQRVQPYAQLKFKPTDRLTINAGLHAHYFSLGNALSPVEPRVGLQYTLGDRHVFALGGGMHSQSQNMYLYFFRLADSLNRPLAPHNLEMGFTKAMHAVASYGTSIGKRLLVKTEVYYQRLYEVPVTKAPSSFSLINTGIGFTRFFPDTLVNNGAGYNCGVELTLQRAFHRGWFGMLTGSWFNSRYEGSDNVERNSDFNSGYVANALGTKEWTVREKHTFGLGGKVTVQGGRWYGPADTVASKYFREVVYKDAERNTLQFAPYFRADLKLNYRVNAQNVGHEIGLDIVNVFDTRNVLSLTYAPNEADPAASPIRYEYQLGRLPLFYYRIDF